MIHFTPPPKVHLFGPFVISSHGVFFLTGAVAAYFYTRHRTPKQYHNALEDILPWMTVSAIIGARLGYDIVNPRLFHSFLDAIAVWRGGLVSYGGLLAAVGAWVLYLRHRGLPIWRLSEAMAPAALLGWGIGRIGCFLTWYGECGVVSHVPWAFVVDGVPRQPVMLYITFSLVFCSWLVPRLARKTGLSTVGMSLIAYGIVRAVCDIWRLWVPSELRLYSQLFALSLAAVGVVVLLINKRSGAATTPPGTPSPIQTQPPTTESPEAVPVES